MPINKKVISRELFADSITLGLDTLSDIVTRTLGPGGLPIVIERVGQQLNGDPLPPMITKDGVTVASECFHTEEEPDVVMQTIKDICQKTNRVAGDGTTTAIALGRAILAEANKYIQKTGVNPQEVKKSLEESASEVIADLKKNAIECKDLDSIEDVATISANGDRAIGKIIRQAFEAVGVEGVVHVDESSGKDHTLDVVNGLQIRRGAEAQDRFFNNTTLTKWEAENVCVVVYDGSMREPALVAEILNKIYEINNGKMPPVLFMANDFSVDVIQLMLIHKAQAGLSVCAVKGPHTTKVRTAMYDDISIFLGGYRLGNGNKNLNNIEYEDVGIADKVVVDKYTTTLFGGAGAEEDVLNRIDQLKAQRTSAESVYDSALLSDRIGALSEGIAKIGVGGYTEVEIKEKYHRIEDAVNAARAAVEEGVVPGGGTTFLRIANKLDADSHGNIILKKALTAPFTILVNNLGLTVPDTTHTNPVKAFCRRWLSKLGLSNTETDIPEATLMAILDNKHVVYDGVSHKVVDALSEGILDPVKVCRVALENAVSISGLLTTCGGAIVYERKK